MFRRARLYLCRNWKKSLLLLLTVTLILSTLLILLPAYRAADEAQQNLAESMGTSFTLEWSINQLTHPDLYEAYTAQDGQTTLYRYIGDEVMTQELLDEILQIDGIVACNRELDENLWVPEIELYEGLYNTYYLEVTLENAHMYSSGNYDSYVAGRNTILIRGCSDSSLHEWFQCGSLKLVEGRHVNDDSYHEIVISTWLAQHNHLTVGDTIDAEALQLYAQGVGTLNDVLGTYTLEIVGLFDVVSLQAEPLRQLEHSIAENLVFSDFRTALECRLDSNAYSQGVDIVEQTETDPLLGSLTFFVNDPQCLQEIMYEMDRTLDMDTYSTKIANPSYAASIQPLKTMKTMVFLFVLIVIVASVSLLYLIIKLQIGARKKEFAILLANGIGKKQIVGQILMELFSLFLIAVLSACLIAMLLGSSFGNILYDIPENNQYVQTKYGEQKVINVGNDTFTPFIQAPSYAPDDLIIHTSVGDVVLVIELGVAIVATAVLVNCSVFLKQTPSKLLSIL